MKTNYVTTGEKNPEIFVTKNKQRLKQYGNTVYLKNGEEFELEFFNPTYNKILAKIQLNGVYIGSGIIIRPGERVFLERYIETSKKFLFETYQIDKTNKEALKAIEENGIVEVEFYRQYIPITVTTGSNIWYTYNLTPINTWGIPNSTSYCNSVTYTSSYASTNTSYNPTLSCNNGNNIETGRIEKGSDSYQTFDYDSDTYDSYPFYKTNWKILPFSQKEITKDDLVVYCGSCGSKRKKDTHKFCPHCGEKY
jgi:hypothetical protein